jgi:hypothetical protein
MTTRPWVLVCGCGVGWSPKAGIVCWNCGRRPVRTDARQLNITSGYSLSPVGKALEDELAGKPRDWEGDPTGWRQSPKSWRSRRSRSER